MDILLKGVCPPKRKETWHDHMEDIESVWSENRPLIFENVLRRLSTSFCSVCFTPHAIIICNDCHGAQYCLHCDDSVHQKYVYHNRIVIGTHLMPLSPLEVVNEDLEFQSVSKLSAF